MSLSPQHRPRGKAWASGELGICVADGHRSHTPAARRVKRNSPAEAVSDELETVGYDVTLVVSEGADNYWIIDGRQSVPTIGAIIEAATR